MTTKKLMNFALHIGEVMLKSGAETYRVEDSINRILATSKGTDIESYVTPTGLFASMDSSDGTHLSYVRRINHRSIHLYRIEMANEISRLFCGGHLELDDAIHQLKDLEKSVDYNPRIATISVSMAAGLFAIVFGGTLADALVTMFAGLVLALFQILLSKKEISQFFMDMIGGLLTTTTALIFLHFVHLGDHQDIILISSIMPLVPGVAITNAIRDTLHGHLVSGTARILDAFIIAASIATGVGISLSIFEHLIGGIIR